MKKRLLLLSNSTNPGGNFLDYPEQHIRKFLGEINGEIVFIPYAAVNLSFDEYLEKVQSQFKDWGYAVTGIHQFDDQLEAVKKCSAIVVGGGNTFALLSRLYDENLLDSIRARVREGVPYIGWSAGSNLACPTIGTTNDMPIVEPESFKALDLVPFQINPHYTEKRLPGHGGEGRRDRLDEFISRNPDRVVVGLPEGNILWIDGDKISLLGEGPLTVFQQGKDPYEVDNETGLDFYI